MHRCISVKMGTVAIPESPFTACNYIENGVMNRGEGWQYIPDVNVCARRKMIEGGKDGAADPMFETNRSDCDEFVASVELEVKWDWRHGQTVR